MDKMAILLDIICSMYKGITLIEEGVDRPAIEVPLEHMGSLMLQLRKFHLTHFDMLCDHTAIDWPKENRIELVYQLYSTHFNHHLSIYVKIPRDNPIIPTVSHI